MKLADLANVCFGSILLKNSVFAADEEFLAP